MNILDHYKQSHDLRASEDYEVSINDQGARLGAPAPVEGRFFYPEGDAPRPQYEGDMLERTGQALEDVGQTAKSMAVGAGAGMAGLPGDVVALTGGLARLLFPGDEGRIQGATDTITKISEAIGSERILGLYRDLVNESDMSAEDKQMALDAAETGSFLSIPGVGATAAVGKDAIKEGVVKAGQAADARIADRAADTGVTLAAGADPMPAVDAAISAAGRAVRPAKNVDEAKAAYDASPNDPVLRQQYLDLRRARDAELSQMPVSEQLELDTSYRMQHQPRGPQDGGGRLDDITAGGELFPEDVYSADGLRFYGNPKNSFDRQSHAAILAARGNPEAEITIYRAVPTDVNQINAGDWVTLSPDYAAMHAASGYGRNGDEAGKVISMKVKVKDVFSDGNDLNEFGYFPEDLAELGVKKVVPPKPDEPGIVAFHGSGADFDEFRLEMIGTGEGAQAYGYGLYFTDSEDIAKFYRDTIGAESLVLPSGNTVRTYSMGDMAVVEDALPNELEQLGVINQAPHGTAKYNKPSVLIAEAIGEAGSDDLVGNARKYLETKLETESSYERQKFGFSKAEGDALEQANVNALTAFDKMIEAGIETKRGKTYKVGLAPKPDELLDYDKSLRQQPKFAEALKPLYEEYGVANTADVGTLFESIKNQRGISAKSLSDRLSAAGIPGIKYATNDTRSKQFNLKLDVRGKPYRDTEPIYARNLDDAKRIEAEYKEKGFGVQIEDIRKSNYVIFDDKAVKILEKYGIVGPVAVTAASVSQTNTEAADGQDT